MSLFDFWLLKDILLNQTDTWYGDLLRFGRNIYREFLTDEGEYEGRLTHIPVAHQEDPDLLPSSTSLTLHTRIRRDGIGVSEMYVNSSSHGKKLS